MRVLFVSSEAVPYAKSGGLGDAVSALAWTLARLGHEVRVLLPRYYFVNPAHLEPLQETIEAPNREQLRLFADSARGRAGVPQFLFLDYEAYFGRDGIYGTKNEPSFGDNPERFALLCRAAVLLGESLEWYPDVIHIHDWPTALVPLYRELLQPRKTPGVVLTVHNGGYQGEFERHWVEHLQIPQSLAEQSGLYHFDHINFLKSAVVSSDEVTTVSPTYASELQREETGFGLAPLYRARSGNFTGIVNGIDYDIWDPRRDPHLPYGFDQDSLDKKRALKSSLQAEMALPVDEHPALIGMVTRLAGQKGIRELLEPGYGALQSMLEELPIQLALLGNGESWCEEELLRLNNRYANLRCVLGFDEGVAHRIEAGSDFFLMPSIYEPCGLNQMYSLRYGTIPIVTRTGGLADTVVPFDPSRDAGTGFFIPYATPWDIAATVRDAVRTYHEAPDAIARMRRRGMSERFSWERSAERYLEVYERAASARG